MIYQILSEERYETDNSQIERYSIWSSISERQIKTRWHTSISILEILKWKTIWQYQILSRVKSNYNICILLVEQESAQPLWKIAWQFNINLNIYLSYDTAITVLDIHPKEVRDFDYTKAYEQMFLSL